MASLGAYSINEIRANEDEDPIDDKLGDARLVPMNMMTLEHMVEGQSLKAVQPKQAAAQIIESVFARSLRKEERAVSRKSPTAEWAHEFYGEIAKDLNENFDEITKPALELAGMEYSKMKATVFIDRYAAEGEESALVGIDLHIDTSSETARKFIESMI